MPHQPVLAPLVDRDSRMCWNKLGIIGRQAQIMLMFVSTVVQMPETVKVS